MPTQPTVKYFLAAALPSDAATPGMTISTSAPDREGDRVIATGGDFKNFLKNPVLVWSHDYKLLPIGRVTSIEVQAESIKAEWTWLDGDEFAGRVRNAFEQGVVNASSIGFIPKEAVANGTGHDIVQWELLELTLCAIPMNPGCVRTMKGVLDDADLKANVAIAVSVNVSDDADDSAMAVKDDMGGVEQDAQLDAPLIPMDDDSKYPFVSATGLTGDRKLALIKGINDAVAVRFGQKRGRRLSAANEAKLQNAHAHLTAAHDTVKDVLDCVKDETRPTIGGGNDDDEGGDAAGMIALSLSDDDDTVMFDGVTFKQLAALDWSSPDARVIRCPDDVVLVLSDTPRLTLDIKDVEDVMDVDPDVLRAALRDVIGATLRDHVTAAMQTAVDRARGRVVV